jgi:gamma-glutamylcysteine synthetase
VSRISLSYNEKKLVQERFEHLLNLEKIKNSKAPPSTDELVKFQEKFVDLQKENISLTETLAGLKQQELELMKEVAEVLASSAQKAQVQKILDEARIIQLQVDMTCHGIAETEMSKTPYVKKAMMEVERYVDEQLQKKHDNMK